jgi:hypothetical protein
MAKIAVAAIVAAIITGNVEKKILPIEKILLPLHNKKE